MRRPFDDDHRYLYTYLVPSDRRLRLDIAPHPLATKDTLLGNIHTSAKRQPLAFCKRVHRYTHATADEMKLLCEDANMLDDKLVTAIDQVYSACEVCVKNGRPLPSRKISLSHVNQAFNIELQVDFMFPTVRGKKHTVMNMTDTGTNYSELAICVTRGSAAIIHAIETVWIYRHGAPDAISADDEYNCTALQQFLRIHGITFKPRPTRRHNKTGIFERKNATVKSILSKLNDESSEATAATLIERAAFLSNMFSGSKILSSFELVRGYQPSVVGLPRTLVTQELLDAHKEQTATRKLQRLLHSKAHTGHQPTLFNPGDPVWVFYNTSKQNEPTEWVKATVVSAHPHFLEARRSLRGRPMRVAYEDVRFAPRTPLTAELMSCTLEEEMNKPIDLEPTEEASPRDTSNTAVPVEDEAPPQETHTPTRHALLTTSKPDDDKIEPAICPDRGEKDIGQYASNCRDNESNSFAGRSLQRDLTREIDQIHEIIGSKQVTASKLSFAPQHILTDALEREHASNWTDAYEVVSERDVPRHANVITSHVVYKLKTDEDGTRKLKARIVPHGNHDDEKDNILKDSSNASLCVVRLMLSLVTFLGFRIGTADITGAFLQSGPITRQIYVRPPREWPGARGTLWKLRKLPYGIVDAGRQWQKTVEDWMLNIVGLERVFGIPQLFVRRDRHGRILLLVAKVTDDFLIGGLYSAMRSFTDMLEERFEVGKIIIDDLIHYDGCEIHQSEDGSITMSMDRYLKRLKPIELSRARKKQRQDLATSKELSEYRSLAATLMFLGNAVLPQAAYTTSLLQQMITRVRVEELVTANEMLKECLELDPRVVFQAPPVSSEITEVVVSAIADASFNNTSTTGYGQTSLISGLRIKLKEVLDIFHAIDWSSSKQRRVSYSPYGAEVIACAEADDRGFYLKAGINALFPQTQIRNELVTDSKCLYDTITTLHESRDYRLRPTVQRIRNSFDSRELNHMRWIPGTINPADALTKRSPNTWSLLNKTLATGRLCINVETGHSVDSETWQ